MLPLSQIKFARKPIPYHWRRWKLGDSITNEQRTLAATITSKDWGLPPDQILDQADTPHCVGFGWGTWSNCPPVPNTYSNEDCHAIYYEAVAIGGVPRTEEGATTEWGVKAMVARKRVQAFAFAASVEDMIVWILTKGPLVTGLTWTYGMGVPDSNGRMHARGSDLGGHETTWTAFDRNTGLWKVANSWNTDWAQGGFGYLSTDDMAKQMDREGDCCTAVELQPVPEPTPLPEGCLSRVRRATQVELQLLTTRESRRAVTARLNDLNREA